jgi:hypothetical protein
MWELRGQFSRPMAEWNSNELEWSAIFVDTEDEAELWWKTRTASRSFARRVSVMFNPQGEVVRVHFN